jgi:signal transduction histidine kinase
VTALHAARASLQAQRVETELALTKLRSLTSQLPIVLWSCDRDLRVTSAEGTHADVVAPLVAAVDHRPALAGSLSHVETELDDKRWLVSLAPMRDAEDEIVGVIGTAVDVTMMRRLEQKISQTQKIESLGVLAGGVAHDFNNLLVAILGNADLALQHPIADPTVRQAVEAIRTASLRASELTNQLLAYSGRGQLEVGAVEVAPLVREMISLLLPGRIGTLELELADVAPVRADAAQIRQVVMNLVTNAFDALTGVGGVVMIRTRHVEVTGEPHPLDVITAPPGQYVTIEVGDSGIGMDVSTRRKIFDPFFTTKQTGHGLGLAAVLGIVRGHRGGLRLFSEPHKGSVFEVLLPAATPTTPVRVATPVGEKRLKTVMVVDDEEMVREVLCHMIEDLGYRAVGVPGGSEALAIADQAEQPIDLAIVDLTMPRMNGRAVADGLADRRPTLPVVLTSGYDRDRIAADTAAGFLRKPFRFDTLEKLLLDVLGAP